jgi:hypothetical protein
MTSTLIEQFQQADRTVIIPEALRPFMLGYDRIPAPLPSRQAAAAVAATVKEAKEARQANTAAHVAASM